jgi:DNA-binding response OmpR family regulator
VKILLVDDDTDLVDVTTYALRKHGYAVTTVTDGLKAVQRFRDEQPDLVVLDVGLPRLNGFEVCRKIREQSDTPVIMVTGRADDENVVQGFLVGADDYVVKPFSHRQLAARIRAVLNRAAGGRASEPTGVVSTSDLRLDPQSHEVTKDGLTVRLTPLEFRILHILAANAGRVVPYARLIEFAWGHEGGSPSHLKIRICSIRKKLGLPVTGEAGIKAIVGTGYTLRGL